MEYRIVNVVCTANLQHLLDVERFSQLPNVVYSPESYFCAYFKDDAMQSRVSVFPSGKLISVGGKKVRLSVKDLLYTQRVLVEHDLAGNSPPIITVNNIVAMADLGMFLNLDEVSETKKGLIYDPEQFPAIIFKPIDKSFSVLVFGSGKLILAGLKSEHTIKSEIEYAIRELGLSIYMNP